MSWHGEVVSSGWSLSKAVVSGYTSQGRQRNMGPLPVWVCGVSSGDCYWEDTASSYSSQVWFELLCGGVAAGVHFRSLDYLNLLLV